MPFVKHPGNQLVKVRCRNLIDIFYEVKIEAQDAQQTKGYIYKCSNVGMPINTIALVKVPWNIQLWRHFVTGRITDECQKARKPFIEIQQGTERARRMWRVNPVRLSYRIKEGRKSSD